MKSPYVILDFETTGFGGGDRVIEIAALRVDGAGETEFHSLCNPGRRLPSRIVELTGLTDADLADAPPTSEAIRRLAAEVLFDHPVLVGHNVSFDRRFLSQELVMARLPQFRGETVCTMSLARRFFPQLPNHKLPDLIRHFRIASQRSHRALDDVRATRELLLILLEAARRAGAAEVEALVRGG